MDTTIMATSPIPWRRSGRQRPRSSSAPAAKPMAMASTVAGMSWRPARTFRYQATTAPKVTSSPWAKLVSPVVPKMSDSPMAVMAITRPNLMPSTDSWRKRSTSVVTSRSRAPRSKRTVRFWFGVTRNDTWSRSSASETSSGRVSVSSVTVYWPGPGSGTSHRPSSSEVTRSTSSPAPSATTTSASATGSSSWRSRVPWRSRSVPRTVSVGSSSWARAGDASRSRTAASSSPARTEERRRIRGW
jgi:hypothetical protein